MSILRPASHCVAFILGVGLLVLGLASSAGATGFTGTTLDAAYYIPDTSTVYPLATFTPSSFVVGAGQETVGDVEGVTQLLVDFTDDSLTITLDTVLVSPTWLAEAFNGVIFDSVATLDIASATVDGATTMAGFDDSRVTFNANQILVNWGGLSYVDGTEVIINFAFTPEPGTGLLLALGLAGLALRRNGRRG